MIGRHAPDANAPIRTDGKHSKTRTKRTESDSESVYEASAAQKPGSIKREWILLLLLLSFLNVFAFEMFSVLQYFLCHPRTTTPVTLVNLHRCTCQELEVAEHTG